MATTFFTLFGTLIGTKLLYVVGRQMYLFIEAGNYFILKFVCQMHTVIYLPRNTVESVAENLELAEMIYMKLLPVSLFLHSLAWISFCDI